MDSVESGHPSLPQSAPVDSPVAVGAAFLREPVTLVKGTHRWTFTCDAGDEAVLLRRLSELAAGTDTPFDWFDAALVSHQLSKRLKSGLYRIDGGNTGTST